MKPTNATEEEFPLIRFSTGRSSTKPFESTRVLNKQSNTLGPKQLADKLKDHFVCKFLIVILIAIEELLVPVCICIVSRLPLMKTFCRLLRNFNKDNLAQLKYPLEVYINYLTSSIPYVPRAFFPFSFQVLDLDMLEITPSAPNELPMCDMNFHPLVKSLSPENIIKSICIILSEHSILFISKRNGYPGYIIRTLLSLIFPFKYNYICIPTLPWKLIDVIHLNSPYVIGIHKTLYEQVKESLRKNVWIVDLDKHVITYNKEIVMETNAVRGELEENVLKLSECEYKKLLSRITSPLSKLKNAELNDKEKKELKEKVRDAFFILFVNIFKGLNNFVKKINGEYIIDKKKLFKYVNDDNKWFLYYFKDKIICKNFLNSKEEIKNSEQACNYLIFKECTATNIEKKSLMDIQKTSAFGQDIKKLKARPAEIITVLNQDKKYLNEEYVLNCYLSKSTVLPLSQNKENKELHTFSYKFFPELVPELLKTRVEEAQDLVKMCEEELGKSNLIANCFLHEKKYLNVTYASKVIKLWLYLWCKVLPSQDIYEHDYRLSQLIHVLSLYDEHRVTELVRIYSLIIQACFKYSSARLAILFFESIEMPVVSSNAEVFNWYLAALNSRETAYPLHKHQSSEESKNNNSLDYQLYFKSCQQAFRQRSFLVEDTERAITEEVKFGFGFVACENCKEITMHGLPKDKAISIYTCPKCSSKLNCKLRVRIGRPVIYLNPKDSCWQGEFPLITTEVLENELNNIESLNVLREKQEFFWSFIWHFKFHDLPYDLFLPYKEANKRTVLNRRTQSRKKTGVLFNKNKVKDNAWLDQFRQVRTLVFCTDTEAQTELN